MELHLEHLPRTVELSRDDSGSITFKYIDEQLLPDELVVSTTTSWEEVVDAIKRLSVRGAPAIGLAGVAALALWAAEADSTEDYKETADIIATARPTAVNLRWAIEHAVDETACAFAQGIAELRDALFSTVKRMEEEDEATNREIGANGAKLLAPGSRILTHCNAGSLATSFFGTALGIIYTAAEQGKVVRVYADETRPVGQGARLTAWELSRVGIPTTLICDNMAASLMSEGMVDAVIVGADRIARNGDAANKIGTYGVAIMAHEHGIPFYVAAPTSTIDPSLSDGSGIVIEQRPASEVLQKPIPGVDVWNPAFDVTPARLISKIITEKGVFDPGNLNW